MVIVAGLAGAGSLLQRLAAPAWQAARERQPALRLDSSLTAAGQGVTLGLLGGFRALVADATWIRVYALWERRDLAGVQNLIQLVATLDPRPAYFWINGARIMGHDFAAWRMDAAGGYDSLPPAERSMLEVLGFVGVGDKRLPDAKDRFARDRMTARDTPWSLIPLSRLLGIRNMPFDYNG